MIDRGPRFRWRGQWRGRGTTPLYSRAGTRGVRYRADYAGLDDYILDALSSYRDTTRAELGARLASSYGHVDRRALSRHLAKLLGLGLVIEVDRGVFRRPRARAGAAL